MVMERHIEDREPLHRTIDFRRPSFYLLSQQ
jgi:hypothetical protein